MKKKINVKVEPEWGCKHKTKEEILQGLYESTEILKKPKYHNHRIKGLDSDGKHYNIRILEAVLDDGSQCELFWKFFENVERIIEPIKDKVDIDSGHIVSTVEKKPKRAILRKHPYVGFHIGKSHIRIVPHGDSIEISRVWIDPDYHRKGIGTALIELVMNGLWFLNDLEPPKVMLEVTGFVGTGKTEQQTPIGEQCRFFRKFGFRVVESSNKGGYRRMVFKDYSMYQNRLKELLDEKKNEEEIEYLNVA
jgi:GNAT superfamily N-acetyltransferase